METIVTVVKWSIVFDDVCIIIHGTQLGSNAPRNNAPRALYSNTASVHAWERVLGLRSWMGKYGPQFSRIRIPYNLNTVHVIKLDWDRRSMTRSVHNVVWKHQSAIDSRSQTLAKASNVAFLNATFMKMSNITAANFEGRILGFPYLVCTGERNYNFIVHSYTVEKLCTCLHSNTVKRWSGRIEYCEKTVHSIMISIGIFVWYSYEWVT